MNGRRFDLCGRVFLLVLCGAAALASHATTRGEESTGRIAFLGIIRDQTDFAQLGIGKAGYWFPQFNTTRPVAERPTGENARDALPKWVEPLNHVTSFLDRT